MSDNGCDKLVQVAVAAPVDHLFTYAVDDRFEDGLHPGQLVEVPFGKGTRRGVVMGPAQDAELAGLSIKPVAKLAEAVPVFSQALLSCLRWAADYYLVPPGEMVFAALPPLLRKPGASTGEKTVQVAKLESRDPSQIEEATRRAPLQARLIEILEESGDRPVADLAGQGRGVRQALRALERKGLVSIHVQTRQRRPEPARLPAPTADLQLNPDQQQAYSELVAALELGRYGAFLLHGVTGSGKTEVYLRAIGKALEAGRGAILLVPEISLTPQLLSRVAARFGRQVAVLHSGLSEGERLDEWRRLQRGEARVAVGARSAVFAPVERPGILIVDEEHDSSYKQSERLPYNGRDLAMVRAREEGALVLLGTATPSIEAYAHARQGRSRLLELKERVQQRAMPVVEVVDLKETLPDPIERYHTLSPRLSERLAETLDRGEQAILFLNRRGYSSFALCKDCGQSVKCVNCSVALVHHLKEHALRCHYCGLQVPVPKSCDLCGGGRINLFGLGTEKCEAEVRRRFPGARVIRMDSDSTTRRGALTGMMERFVRGDADVMVGTQMVTKGHDLPGVTLVGVLLADLSIHLPDFRAQERTFQLLVQVAGRAGRGERPGRVVIQTFLPEHECVTLAQKQLYADFFRLELARRQKLGYPPEKRLMLVRVSCPDQDAGAGLARQVSQAIRKSGLSRDGRRRLEVLGPAVSPLARLRGRYRWQMLVKSRSVADLRKAWASVQHSVKLPKNARILFDVDPYAML